MKKTVVVALLVLLIAGCGFNPFSWFRKSGSPQAPRKSTKHYDWDEKVEKEPVAVVTNKDGKVTVLNKTTKTLHVTHDEKETEVPLTWWQRMCRWFGNLTTIGIVLVIIGAFACPGVTFGLVFRGLRRARTALKEMVKAAKESNAIDDNSPAFHDALKSNLTTNSKILVGKIKAML